MDSGSRSLWVACLLVGETVSLPSLLLYLIEVSLHSLESIDCWLGPGPCAKMSASTRAYAGEYSLIYPPPVSVPSVSHQPSPTSPGDPSRPASRSGPGSYHIAAFVLYLGLLEILYVSLRMKSLFPSRLRRSCSHAPLAFEAKCSSLSGARHPAKAHVWENLCNNSPVCGSPT